MWVFPRSWQTQGGIQGGAHFGVNSLWIIVVVGVVLRVVVGVVVVS